MSIGEVLGLLRGEFADITISKLRFLEAEGLVEPMRTTSGYRKYTPAHLDRLRLILAAQRDRYLPLRVIREQLEAMDRGERVLGLAAPPVPPASPALPAAPARPAPPPAPARPASPPALPVPREAGPGARGPASLTVPSAPSTGARAEVGEARLTRAQLAERAGLDEAAVADLEQYGLLRTGPSGHYGGEALTVARIAALLSAYGLEARHLRPYRATADREVGLLAQLLPPLARQAGGGGRVQALETVHELAALCAQLHGALVRQGLRQVLGA
jgi:DNA-binding transcriptional MerR regulator